LSTIQEAIYESPLLANQAYLEKQDLKVCDKRCIDGNLLDAFCGVSSDTQKAIAKSARTTLNEVYRALESIKRSL
jgi:hypothetical protein